MGKNKWNGQSTKKQGKKTCNDDADMTFLQNEIENNKNSNHMSLTPALITKNKTKIDKKYNGYPNVSICTPTFNRRPFFKGLIECVRSQIYPHYKIEWIIVDDGTDCVRDIFEDEHFISSMSPMKIRYFYEPEKMDLGKKRNYMHEKCTFTRDEDVIVYMDDDDFYPPERVSHSVEKLMKNPKALCGGSSEIFLWFNTLNKMYKFGPYGPNHATAGTFAFRRKLLADTSYEDSAILAEEKHFLKNYTVPFVQFDPLKTILVFSHEQNTFDKRRLINDKNKFCNESELKVNQFIKSNELRSFYQCDIGDALKSYEPGDVKNKPKVLEEIERRDKQRVEMVNNRPSGIFATNIATGEPKELTMKELNDMISRLQRENEFMKKKLVELHNENIKMKNEKSNEASQLVNSV
jgi:glycosyltransferase involved in cell wall biosynthesis